MRDCLYLWHNPELRFVVASGIEIKDILRCLNATSGLLMLSHDYGEVERDPSSRFDYVPSSGFQALGDEDVYSWGDICWVDYAHPSFPMLTKSDVAELLYFKHTGEPFGNIAIPSLKNRFLVIGHDDGWYLKLYYESWSDMADLLAHLKWVQSLVSEIGILAGGDGAFWMDDAGVIKEERTFDIDSILNRRCRRRGQAI